MIKNLKHKKRFSNSPKTKQMKLMERSSSPKTNFVKKSKNYADINLPNKKNVQRIARKKIL